MLRLEQAQKEAVILACTMTDEAQATLFEIDVASNFVLTPVKDPLFPKSPIFLKTVSYCEDEAEPWRRQIKVGARTVAPFAQRQTFRKRWLVFAWF